MTINKVDIAIKKQPNWFFNIREINLGYQDYDESVPHQHTFYEILFLEKGNGVHEIDGKKYEVEDNSIHFLSPKHVHHLVLNKPSKGFVCMFKEELFYINNENNKFLDEVDLFSNWSENPILKINESQIAELKKLLKVLKLEYSNNKHRKNEILLMLLKVFLIKASRLNTKQHEPTVNSKRGLIEQFLGLLEENHQNNLPVSFYANKLNVTTTYLNRVVKEKYGVKISKFINDRMILEAKRILKYSSKSIKEVAYELGFDDPSYFSRFFKKYTDLTPVKYRKEIQG